MTKTRHLWLLVLALLVGVVACGSPSSQRAGSNPGGLGGDLSGVPWAATVTGLQGHAVPTPSGTNTTILWNGSSFSWGAGGSTITWANDLAGSTNTSQTVVGLESHALPALPVTPQLLAYTGSAWAFESSGAAIGGTVTGTGFWFSQAGSLDPATASLTGDVSQGAISSNNVPLMVTGAQGKALPVLPGSQQLLGYSGTAWNFTAPSSIFTAGGDLSGTATSQEVVGLLSHALPSFAAGVLQSNGSAWSLGTVGTGNLAPGTSAQVLMSNATPAAAWTTISQDLSLSATGVASVVSLAGSGGTTTLNSNLTPGSDALYTIGATSKRVSQFNAAANGYQVWAGNTDTQPASKLVQGSILLGIGGTTAPDVQLTRNGIASLQLTNGSNGNATLLIGGTASANEISIASSTTTISIPGTGAASSASAGLTFVTQAVNATSGTPGSFTFNSPAPTSGGSEAGGLVFQRGSTLYGQIRPYPSAPTSIGTIWLGYGISPGSGNFALASDGVATTYLNGVAGISVQISNSGVAQFTSSAFTPAAAGGLTNGTAPLYWNGVFSNTFQFPATLGTSGLIEWSGAATAGGQAMGLVGQNAGGTGNNGGGVGLVGGTGTTTGQGGGIALNAGGSGAGGTFGNISFGYGGQTPPSSATIQASLSTSAWMVQHQAAASATVPVNMVFAPQAPNGATGTQTQNTPGSFVVSLANNGSVGTVGLHAAFQVQDNSQNQFWVGNGGAVSSGNASASLIWLGAGTSGITPASGNFAIGANASTLLLNGPTTQINFGIANTTYAQLQSTGWGGDAAFRPFRWNSPASVSVGLGGTTTISLATLATGPFIVLTSSGTTTSQVVVDFSNATGLGGAFWILDTAGITFGSSLGISVKNGTDIEVVGASGQPNGRTIWVFLDSTSNRVLWR